MTEIVVRAPERAEADALHRLMTTIQRRDGLPMVTDRGEVDDLFDSPDTDPLKDLRVFEVDRTLVAYGIVDHARSGQRHEKATVLGGVHPDWRGRGFGRRLLHWQIERGRTLLAATDHELAAYLFTYAYDLEAATIHLLERSGFERARFDHELGRSLEDPPDPPELDGITIRPWLPEDEEPARLVFNASFADHWGSTPRSVDSWRHMLQAGGQRIDLSFVAVDDRTGDVVGIGLNGHYPDDTDVTGRIDGWIQTLGTLRSHRKSGIASALVLHSLQAFADAGFDHAMLGVDSENPSGAYGIYEALGFAKLNTVVTMQLTVRPAP